MPAVPRPAAGDPSARPFAAQELDRALKFARLSPSSVQPAGSPLPPSPLAPQANSAAASSPTAQSVADLELLKTVIGISQPQVA